MGDNVVWGTDFKAKSERVLTVEEQSILLQAAVPSDNRDTAPSEWNCDSGDVSA